MLYKLKGGPAGLFNGKIANLVPFTGFEISIGDGVWKTAEARIENNGVILRSAEIPNPTDARYAWASWPDANLCNSANLPASPFRVSLAKP